MQGLSTEMMTPWGTPFLLPGGEWSHSPLAFPLHYSLPQLCKLQAQLPPILPQGSLSS